MPTRQAIYNKSERQRRLAAGLCVQCGGPRAASFMRCLHCRKLNRPRQAALMRRRRAAAQS